jgi:thioredoxin-related protein
MNKPLQVLLALGLALCAALSCHAGVPTAYAPTVVAPTAATSGAPPRWEFDLTAAFKRAESEHKRLYVYLGADDCPFCRAYEAFLGKNSNELVPHFNKDYVVIDLRGSLKARADKLFFRVGDKVLNYTDFQRALGDERARQLVYPNVWLLDNQGKMLMQMPAGAGTFQTVPEQLEILRLEQ